MQRLANLPRLWNFLTVVLLASFATGSLPHPLFAATLNSVRVGSITSEKQCQLYQESAGSSVVVASRDAVAAGESWRTWLVKDCKDNFASIRMSLQAALASTGKFNIVPKAGDYVLSGAISDISNGGAPIAAPAPYTNGFSIQSQKMFVNMDVTLRDGAGKIVFGGIFSKSIETGSSVGVGGFSASNSRSGQALYGELQHQVALEVARLVAFRLEPLRVVSNEGRQITLNYGAPLLTLGSIVHVTSSDRNVVVRYSVVSSDATSAIARADNEGDVSRIVPGSIGTVIEAEDPAANGRRLKRVDLP
jgi:hypothetical protein